MTNIKRGQFYLLATLIIIIFIIGFVAISNYSKKKSYTKIYDLGEELEIESAQVTDYGTYNKKNLKKLLEDFTEIYSEYAGEGRDLYFVFGDEHNLIITAYKDLQEGEIFVETEKDSTSSTGYTISVYEKEFTTKNFPISGKDNVRIKIKDINYNFRLDKNQYFYFVISEEIKGEKHITTNTA